MSDRCTHVWLLVSSSPEALPVCVLCGKEPTASPSQVETWRDCQRKHGYSRVRSRPFSKTAAYGDRCHKIAEHWLRDAVPPDAATAEGRTVLAGLHYLPMPRTPGLLVEHRMTPLLRGIRWDMRMDYLVGYVPRIVITLGDHKTTGDIAEYAKSSETLSTTDPQGIAYSHGAAEEFDVETVVGQWTYYQRDVKAASQPVVFSITRDEARERFDYMHETEVLPMVRSRATPPEELPRNLEACRKYGGCPYQAECLATVSPLERAASALTELRRAAAPKELMTAPDLLATVLATPPGQLPPGAPPQLDPRIEAYIATLPADQQASVRLAMAAAAAAPAPVVVPMPTPAPVVIPTNEVAANTGAGDKPDTGAATEPKNKRGRPKSTPVTAVEVVAASSGGEPPCTVDVFDKILDRISQSIDANKLDEAQQLATIYQTIGGAR